MNKDMEGRAFDLRCEEISALLDLMMDEELTEEQQRLLDDHARECPACAGQIRSTRQMKALFSEMPPEVDVPLAAQAAWRSAVKAESRRARRKRFYGWTGMAAAAVVLAVGVNFALNGGNLPNRQGETASLATVAEDAATQEAAYEAPEAEMAAYEAADIAFVEADGAAPSTNESLVESKAFSAETLDADEADIAFAAGESAADAAPMHELKLKVDSVDAACSDISDLVSEYEGELDLQRVDGGANLFIDMPSENVAEFIRAISHLNLSGASLEAPETGGEAISALLLAIEE